MYVFALLLMGCPLPPSDNASETPASVNNPQRPNGGNGGAVGQNPAANMGGKPAGAPPAAGGDTMGGGTGGTGGAAGTGTAGKPGGVLMDMEQMKAQKKQDQIASVDHVTIQGMINGECSGVLRLDVIGTEDLGGPQDGGEMKGPITTKVLETTGAFSIAIPRGASVNLAALCDGDNNNKITADADQLSLGARLGIVDEDITDVTLTLEAIKPPSGDLPPQKPMTE